MTDESIEIGDTPDPAASATIEEPIAPEATSASGPGEAPSGPKTAKHLEVDPKTKEEIFKAYKNSLELAKGHWDYRNKSGPARAASHQMAAAAIHCYAHTYAIDPKLATDMWVKVNETPPGQSVQLAAQNITLADPKLALDSLTTQVEKARKTVSAHNEENRESELRKHKRDMAGPYGDSDARRRELGGSVIDNMIPKQHNQADSGTFLLKEFLDTLQQVTKARQMSMQKNRSNEMGAELNGIDKELKTIDAGKVKMESRRVAHVKQTLGAMGINVSKVLNVKGIAEAARNAMTRKAPVPGPAITAQSIAAQQSQSEGIGI